MSIRFNHASNKMTSTSTATIVIEGGTPTAPQPLRLDASSIIFPNKILPVGEAGAVVFDTTSKSLKYHNGISWVEILSQDDILAPVNVSLTDIYNKLANRVSTVTYSSSAVPSASVSGTNLNIIFPSSTTGGSGDVPGLFTTSPPGSMMHYSLTSGQTVANIREQMSGVTGGQAGRDGSAANPYVTKTGWCFGDGMYWRWNGTTVVTKLVPNMNQNAYLKGISTSGLTKTDTVITGSGVISSTSIDQPQHFHGTGMMNGLSGSAADDATFIFGKTWDDGIVYNGAGVFGDTQTRKERLVNGSDSRTALSTTLAIYPNGNTTTHNHNLSNIDVDHFNVAILYNIAEPSSALNQAAGDARYVLKAGDVMTGSLTIANSATIQANDTNLVMWFRNTSGGERAAIYHASNTNTLRLRSAGGSEMAINGSGNVSAPSFTASGAISGASLTISGAATTGVLNVNGQITATGDIWAFSDRNLKENIKPIESATQKLAKIMGILGNMIDDPDKVEKSMVIAQDVQEVFPQAVTTDDNGFLKVNYIALIPLLIAGFNEQFNKGE